MRISTQSFYEQSQKAMGSQQTNLLRVQQQMGAMTKILSPSDDPVAATRALAVSQSLAINSQYQTSRTMAIQSLSLEESVLQSVTTVLQDIKVLVIQAGSGSLTDTDRSSIATALEGSYKQLQGLANTDDGNGQYLFAGFKSSTPPFTSGADGTITYTGDQGQRLMQVDVSRQMAATDDGRSIFQSVQRSAGYVSEASLTNSGTGVFSSNAVTDPTDSNFGKDFTISFTDASTYVVNTVPPVTPIASGSYTAGEPISFGGVQMSISGTPAAGDSFSVKTAKNAGTDVFGAISDIIKTLKKPIEADSTGVGQANLLNALSTANRKMTNAHDNVLTVRASIGSRLQELDALNVTGGNRVLLDKSHLSELQDLDYASAIAEFYQRQTALEATQKVFVKIQGLSLFNYL
ncbi:MAG: flagellar hook-associated protein 3 [Comamonadaceae bacterium CG_4_9_14_3_um_filter_60_33]|nr:MAG: flagellar hook-associated protein 3 [Comamonadaceae bacterium CG2_30_59_20]PIY29786.1 MAG: flagellar hook-associated protein 3 [Comamonadaceae bacterium CG_4_10_14_3_um_filter_60_42]PJB43639.1 MAG: flagellar hook-associated protein 3 [Comamonadaceae bacterium CG_4_9_14_3_um_filter_60_33]